MNRRWLFSEVVAIVLALSASAVEVRSFTTDNLVICTYLASGCRESYAKGRIFKYLTDDELLEKEKRVAEADKKKKNSKLFRAWCSVKAFFGAEEFIPSNEQRRLDEIHRRRILRRLCSGTSSEKSSGYGPLNDQTVLTNRIDNTYLNYSAK